MSRVRAERLCLLPCISPRPFPYDFTTKAWSTPDGDPRVQGVYHCTASEPSVSAAHTQTHVDSRCCQEIRATNYCSLLFPSLPRHCIKQTSSLWDPPGPGIQPTCSPCSVVSCSPVTCAAVNVLDKARISRGATWAAAAELQTDNKKVLVLARAHRLRTHPSHDVTVAILAQWWKHWPAGQCLATLLRTEATRLSVWKHLNTQLLHKTKMTYVPLRIDSI